MDPVAKLALMHPNHEISIRYGDKLGQFTIKVRPFIGLSRSRSYSVEEMKERFFVRGDNGLWHWNDEAFQNTIAELIDPYLDD